MSTGRSAMAARHGGPGGEAALAWVQGFSLPVDRDSQLPKTIIGGQRRRGYPVRRSRRLLVERSVPSVP
jgi:ABC-type phosphonate transport system ATPase subunit